MNTDFLAIRKALLYFCSGCPDATARFFIPLSTAAGTDRFIQKMAIAQGKRVKKQQL